MKVNDIEFDDKKDWLKITDFENVFNVYVDDKNNNFYNLNSTWYFDIPDENLQEYTCEYNMNWPLISYKIYGTIRLAWFLMKLNKVNAKDIFVKKLPGEVIKYFLKTEVEHIVSEINMTED